jgi:hypothetical protein
VRSRAVAAKLNRFGIVLAAFFAVGGSTLFLGPYFGFSFGSRTTGFLWLGIACLILWRWRRGNIEAGRRAQIVQTGVRGVATVLSASSRDADPGFSKLSLRLELDVPGVERRLIDHQEEVALYAAHGIKPGLKLPVVIDPQNPQNVVLVW